MGERVRAGGGVAAVHIEVGVGAGDETGPAVSATVEIEAQDVAILELNIFATASDDVDAVPDDQRRAGEIKRAEAFLFVILQGVAGECAHGDFPTFAARLAVETDESRAAIEVKVWVAGAAPI